MIIPFFIPHLGCPHQCVFCNQKNITGRDKSADAASIPHTISEYLNTETSQEPVQVAFYGGSFTALPHETQKAYLETTRPFITDGRIKSIRVSTRPDHTNGENLSFLKKHHVDTVELGAQSMDDNVLTLSGRGHTALDTEKAVKLLREYGFSIGLQLMPGLPGDSAEVFMRTIVRTIALKPDFVRLYPALVIKGTPLAELYKAGRFAPLSLDSAIDLCRDALVRLEEAGIEVIRMGLQSTAELEKPGVILGGPYHPAFRQVVESAILLDRMTEVLTERKTVNSEVTLAVNPSDITAAIGQKRSNIEFLKKRFGLKKIHLRPDSGVPRRLVKPSFS